MRYLSVCSGIEAATQAWHPLGWTPVAFSEIEPFPSAVLANHYPHVPNWGDMTKFEDWPDEPIDLLCGGTPCQDYSVAGQRLGMAGARGQLTLTFVEIAARYRPDWLVWENVPGVLSSNGGRDFARFLGDLTGQGIEVPEGGWSNSGIVAGIADAYGIAYRVLDAQHTRTRRFPFAVPQRRRRVWVVGYLGDWRRAAAVLFDRESLSGHPAPGRQSGEAVAALTANGVGTCGADDNQGQAGHLIASTGDVAHCLNAGGMGRQDYETETMVAHSLRGEGFDASEDGTGRGTPIVPVAFDCKGTQVQHDQTGSTPTLRAMGHAESHANAGGQLAVAFDLRGREGGSMPEGPHYTANIRAASGGSSRSYVAQPWAVRRLTPRECERLQGFPDDFTVIPWRKKPADQCPDGPRYKALGNSWAVNVADWVGERIQMVEKL